jgi:hypothetical protein
VLELEQQVIELRQRVNELQAELVAAVQAGMTTPNLPVPVASQASHVVLWRRG